MSLFPSQAYVSAGWKGNAKGYSYSTCTRSSRRTRTAVPVRFYRMGVYLNAPINIYPVVSLVDAYRNGVTGGLGSVRRDVGWEKASNKAPPIRR